MSKRHTNSLKSIFLFKDLSQSSLEAIEACCHYRGYAAGEEIVAYLDRGTDVFFVLCGRAKVKIYSPQGKVVGFGEVGPGRVFGEFSAIDSERRSASIEAEQDCSIAVLSAADFLRVVESEPTVAMGLIRDLVARLRSLTTRVFQFSTLTVNNRIHAELLRLVRSEPQRQPLAPNTALIRKLPTHAEIANLITTHREAVTRHLAYLSRIGLIQRKGRSLVIKDLARLERMVADANGE